MTDKGGISKSITIDIGAVTEGGTAPDANFVSVNGYPFSAPTKLYYKNGSADTTDDSTDYNAHYDPATGVLELKDYNSGPIIIGGSNAYDLTVKLTGTSYGAMTIRERISQTIKNRLPLNAVIQRFCFTWSP